MESKPSRQKRSEVVPGVPLEQCFSQGTHVLLSSLLVIVFSSFFFTSPFTFCVIQLISKIFWSFFNHSLYCPFDYF